MRHVDPAERWHGTPNGYRHHVCRCEDCRGAWARYMVARRANRGALAISGLLPVVHGKLSTYVNECCRCAECRMARRDHERGVRAEASAALPYKRPKHEVTPEIAARMSELRCGPDGLTIREISERTGFSVMTVSRRLSGKVRIRPEAERARFVTRPVEVLAPTAEALLDVRSRLSRVMRAAGDRKRLPIASARAYDVLRELSIDANEVAPWLTAEEVAFADRLMAACERWQFLNGHNKIAEAA